MEKMKLFLIGVLIFVGIIQTKAQRDTTNMLDMSLEELMKMEITTAGKKAEKITEIPASIIMMNRADIEKAGYTTLEEIFQNIPGMYYVNNESFLGPTIGVRGYMTANPSNIMILINGIPQRDALYNTYSFHMAPVPVEAIERIEIVRGPMSVIYGSNAFFGAINIITNDRNNENNNQSTTISSTYGSMNTYKATIYSKGKSGDFDYALTGAFYKTDGIDEPFYKMINNFTANKTAWGYNDTLATSKKYFTVDQKYINFSGKFKKVYFDFGFGASQFGESFSMLFYLPAECKSYFSTGAIGYKNKFSDVFTLDGKIMFTRYDLLMGDNYYSTSPNGFGKESDVYSYGQYWSERIEGELNAFITPSQKINISLGLSIGSILDVGDKTDAPYSGATNLLNRAGGIKKGNSIALFSFFSQIVFQPIEKLRLVVGGRIERMGKFDLYLDRASYYPTHDKYSTTIENTDIQFVPRFAAIYNITENHIIKAMYGEAIKLPDVWSLRNNIISQQSLKPEKIQTMEVNYIAKISSEITTNLSYFHNTLTDISVRSIILSNNNYLTSFTNIGALETNGIELGIKSKPLTNFTIDLNASYQETKNTATELKSIEPEFSPKWLAYFRASYQINEKLNLSLQANYVDKMQAQWDNTPINANAGNFTPNGRMGFEVPAYTTIGANLLVENISIGGNVNLYFNIHAINLLDKEIHYPSTSVSKWADKGVLGFGRSFYFSVGLKF